MISRLNPVQHALVATQVGSAEGSAVQTLTERSRECERE